MTREEWREPRMGKEEKEVRMERSRRSKVVVSKGSECVVMCEQVTSGTTPRRCWPSTVTVSGGQGSRHVRAGARKECSFSVGE